MGRFDVLREIERLDPERDHQRIMHLSFGYEFPWDSVRALEVALYRTYCVPTIPDGYQIPRLAPPKLIEREEQRGAAPAASTE